MNLSHFLRSPGAKQPCEPSWLCTTCVENVALWISNKAKPMPAYSPLRGHPEHNAQACTASPPLPGLCIGHHCPASSCFPEVPQEMLHLAPGLTFEASLLGTRWQGVSGSEVGTSPKGLLPQVTQLPSLADTALDKARGTAQPPATWDMSVHPPSLLTCQPAGFPVTQTLPSEEAVVWEPGGGWSRLSGGKCECPLPATHHGEPGQARSPEHPLQLSPLPKTAPR